ncbi:MAG: TRAP transporter large permease subunit [Chloroflexi bacterium]|nr:TRAP transporter large permease subunit [Chloroflexota bacterium]
MESWMWGILATVLMLVVIFAAVPIAFGLFIGGLAGMFLIADLKLMGGQLASLSYAVLASYSWAVIPMFFLMGQFAAYGRLAEDAFEAAKNWLGRIHGSLAMATTFGCAAFGAASGSSAASVELFAKVAGPEMIRAGYDRSLAAGCIAGSGTMAVMIPPSVILLLYGIIAEQSLGKLLMAGILPGILEAVSYSLLIYLRVRFNPRLAPTTEFRATTRAKITSASRILPILLVFFFAIGGIFFGIFTPTEGGAMGAGGALLVVLAMRRLSFKNFKSSLNESAIQTGMVVFAMLGGLMFSRMLVLSGGLEIITNFVTALPVSKHIIFAGVILIYLILGMVMQATILMLVTVPILLPAMLALGYDPIWFGIMIVRMGEVAMITPPVAVNLYIVRDALSNEGVTLGTTFRGTLWFLAADGSNVLLLYLFPQIALWLPEKMWAGG